MKEKLRRFYTEPILYILIICIIFQVVLCKRAENTVGMYSDSQSYLDYAESVLEGPLHKSRTPIYPILIKIIKSIYGDDQLYNGIVYIQYFIMFISIIIFYFTIKKLTNNKIIYIISTLIYGICPFIFLWNNLVLTESISISAIVLLSYLTISYIKKPTKLFAVILGIYPFLLVMIRPAFIYVVVLYIVFWILKILMDKENREKHIVGIIFIGISIILILIYCILMKNTYGVFGLSRVSYINKHISILDSNTYYKADNKEILNDIENIKKQEGEDVNKFILNNKLSEIYSTDQLIQFFNNAKDNNRLEYFKYMIQKFIKLGQENFGTSYVPTKNNSDLFEQIGYATFPVTFYHVYVLIVVSIIYLLKNLIKNKKIDYVYAFFTFMIFANVFISIVGAPYETQRLVSASIPIILMQVSYIMSKLLKNK